MKKERAEKLLRAVGDVDEELLAAADNGKTVKRLIKPARFAWAAAACLCIAAAGWVGANQFGWFGGTAESTKPWPVYTLTGSTAAATGIAETAVIPHWDAMQDCERFNGMDYDGEEYHTTCKLLSAETVGEKLSTVKLAGYDVYADKEYTKAAEAYKISGIAPDCAVAVQFEDSDDYCIYIRTWKEFETLGDMIESLDLNNTLETGAVRFGESFVRNRDGSSEYHVFEAEVPEEKIREMLLSDESLPNVYDDAESPFRKECFEISVDVPEIGCENHAIELTEDGYLRTNILETGKEFYIGEKRVREFMEYVETCPKSEYVTVIPEEKLKEEKEHEESAETVTYTTSVPSGESEKTEKPKEKKDFEESVEAVTYTTSVPSRESEKTKKTAES